LNVNLEVMVAGNDEEFAASLKNALLDVGCKHSVKSAATFNEFKNYLRKNNFHIVFFDCSSDISFADVMESFEILKKKCPLLQFWKKTEVGMVLK